MQSTDSLSLPIVNLPWNPQLSVALKSEVQSSRFLLGTFLFEHARHTSLSFYQPYMMQSVIFLVTALHCPFLLK